MSGVSGYPVPPFQGWGHLDGSSWEGVRLGMTPQIRCDEFGNSQ